MVVTRGGQRRGVEEQDNHSRIAKRAAEQEKQVQADRAMIATYRQAWKEDRGILHAIYRYDIVAPEICCASHCWLNQLICCHADIYEMCCGGCHMYVASICSTLGRES